MLVDLDHDTSLGVASLWKYLPVGEVPVSWNVIQRVLYGILALHLMFKGSKSYPPVRALVQTIVTLWFMKLAAITAFVVGEELWMGDSQSTHDDVLEHGTEDHSCPWSMCCHKRRAARFWKCTKRRERRHRRAALRAEAFAQRTVMNRDHDRDRDTTTGSDISTLQDDNAHYTVTPCRFVVAFCNTLSLPPPLPFVRRRRCVYLNTTGHQEPEVIEDIVQPVDAPGPNDDSSLSATEATNDRSLDTDRILVVHPKKLPSQGLLEQAGTQVTRRKSHLIDIVRMQQWQLLLNHPQECISRQETKYRDADGLYPLHWAVAGGAPTELVQRLAETYPSAVRRPDHEGSTPLHFATHYGSKAVVFLLQLYPEAASKLDTHGRSPLFHAVSTQPLSVLMVLVQTAPTMITTPCYSSEERKRHLQQKLQEQGRFSRKRRSLTRSDVPVGLEESEGSDSSSRNKEDALVSRDESVRTPLYRLWNDVLMDPIGRSQCRGKTWDKAVWLLLAAYHRRVETATTATTTMTATSDSSMNAVDVRDLLQASIQMDVYLPESVLPLLISAYPEHLSTTNALGQVPLSLAITSDSVRSSDCTWTQNRAKVIVQEVLRAWTGAASHINPQTGRSALMEAIVAGHVWTSTTIESTLGLGGGGCDVAGASGDNAVPSVLQQLIQAAPDLLQARDGATGLSPALLAALPRPLEIAVPQGNATANANANTSRTNADPYHLLSTKQRALLESPGQMTGGKTVGVSRRNEEAQLETVFALLRADPAQLIVTL